MIATASREEPLTDAEREQVLAMVEENKRLEQLYCTGCNYCTPCPNGVNSDQVNPETVSTKDDWLFTNVLDWSLIYHCPSFSTSQLNAPLLFTSRLWISVLNRTISPP